MAFRCNFGFSESFKNVFSAVFKAFELISIPTFTWGVIIAINTMASNLPQIFQENQKGGFATVHTSNQIVGEVDPFFVASIFEELGMNWEIYDSEGIPHNLGFNGSPTKPLITTGWESLRRFYSWKGEIKLGFYYYGQNKFLMVIIDKSQYVRPSFYPAYHSMSFSIGTYRTFLLRIGDNDVTLPTMRISKEMDKFINGSHHSFIKFCGPYNKIVMVAIIIDPEKPGRFRFGEGWSTFCEINGIVEGNLLYLKMDSTIEYSHIVMVQFA